jgi:predicted transcriptional regulator
MKIWGWFARAWHDPVGSKVIAGVILAGLGATWLWAESGWSSSLTVIWASTLAIVRAPIAIPFGVAILTLATFAAIFIRLTIRERALRLQYTTLLAQADEVRAWYQRNVERKKALAAELAPMDEELRLLSAIGYKQQEVMSALADAYPEPMEVQQLATNLAMNFASAEKICEDIAAEGFLTISASGHHPMKATLTKAGRDYLVKLENFVVRF